MTICFTHEGQLYVPASDAEEKKWPQYLLEAATTKYPRLRESLDPETLARVWVFRIEASG